MKKIDVLVFVYICQNTYQDLLSPDQIKWTYNFYLKELIWWARRMKEYLMNIICHIEESHKFSPEVHVIPFLISLPCYFLDFNNDLLFLLELMTSHALVLFKTCWTNTFFLCSPGDNRNSSFAFEKIQCIMNKTVNDILISCKTNIIVNRIQLLYSLEYFKLSFNTKLLSFFK